jgi:hypothetical protein
LESHYTPSSETPKEKAQQYSNSYMANFRMANSPLDTNKPPMMNAHSAGSQIPAHTYTPQKRGKGKERKVRHLQTHHIRSIYSFFMPFFTQSQT